MGQALEGRVIRMRVRVASHGHPSRKLAPNEARVLPDEVADDEERRPGMQTPELGQNP